jgi:hypothetical protein|tara:strand:+ start:15304 stop:16446 length:1143 start_codon:yes stop_codon:yes gene_type:complete
MANTKIWQGTSQFLGMAGQTPFGHFDADTKFRTDADTVAAWCAKRLGYPIVDIELQDVQFWACFEEAVTEYGAQVQRFQIRQNLLEASNTTRTDLTNRTLEGNNGLIGLSQHYGTEALSGGNVTLKSGSINIEKGTQSYNLQALYGSASESNSRLEIRKIFHNRTPASRRYLDEYAGNAHNPNMALKEFGFQNRGAGASFMLLPMYDILLRNQQVEFSDMVRKSAYSFELQNNVVKLFPKPTSDFTLWFQYYTDASKTEGSLGTINNVTSFADIDYRVMTYSRINAPGIQWIKKYTLSLAKELLGQIRSKYASVPVPGGEVSLDGDSLRGEGAAEKENLITQLREDLEASSRRNMLEAKKEESEFLKETIGNVPLNIYIG